MLGSDSTQNQNVALPNTFIVLTFLFYRRKLKAGHVDRSFPVSQRKTVTESGI